jgi:acetylglutamate kinase
VNQVSGSRVNRIVLKIGGSTLGQHDTTLEDIVALQKRGVEVVVIHGGGKIITDWLGKLGAATEFVQGERVTDKAGLEVATAVLAGLVNKQLVSSLIRAGGRAIGLSGVDGALIQGQIKEARLGYVGEVTHVEAAVLETLLKAGYLPVVSSIGLSPEGTPNGGPLMLNINADVAAGEVAATLGADKLIFLTDVAGVCDRAGRVIAGLSVQEAEEAIASGVASGGMIPKIRAGIRALQAAGSVKIIDGREAHALIKEIERGEGGTTILADRRNQSA